MGRFSGRWLAAAVFIFSSVLNYMDRNLLAVLAPLILKEFHLSQLSFGYILSVFSIVYAFSSLGAGFLLDRIGLNKSITAAVAWWSTASIFTAFTHSSGGLALVRASLAVGESAGVPAFGKFNALYLRPAERALGTAANQIGLSLGSMLAAAAVPIALVIGWRWPFAACGALGLIWLPLWQFTSRKIPPTIDAPDSGSLSEKNRFKIWKTVDLWALVAANVLWMGIYALWSNWTTLYLVHVHHISVRESARYVWIPALVSNFGGFFGGWLSLRWINRGVDPVAARKRAVWASTLGALTTLALPSVATPQAATAIISVSFFFCLAGSVNIYALPLDIFGPRQAGMAIGALTFAFGLLQTAISPMIGWLSDHGLYSQVVWLVSIPLILSASTLHACGQRREGLLRPLKAGGGA